MPISTDPLTKLNAVHAKCSLQNGFLLFLALPILFVWNRLFIGGWDYNAYLSFMHLLGTFFLPVMAIFVIVSGGGYFLWYRKAKRDAEAGRSPVYRRSRVNKAANAFMQAYILFGLWGGLLLDSWYERHRSSLIVIGIVIAGVILYMIGYRIYLCRCAAQSAEERTSCTLFCSGCSFCAYINFCRLFV